MTMTEAAKQRLMDTLETNTDDQKIGLRLAMGSSGELGCVFDREVPNENIVGHKGSKVLPLEQELFRMLEGFTLDVKDATEDPRLKVFKEWPKRKRMIAVTERAEERLGGILSDKVDTAACFHILEAVRQEGSRQNGSVGTRQSEPGLRQLFVSGLIVSFSPLELSRGLSFVGGG